MSGAPTTIVRGPIDRCLLRVSSRMFSSAACALMYEIIGVSLFLYAVLGVPRMRSSHPCQLKMAKRSVLDPSSAEEAAEEEEEEDAAMAGEKLYSRSNISSVPNSSAVPDISCEGTRANTEHRRL